MDVFGHDHISQQLKSLRAANLVKDSYETIPGANSAQQGKTPVTTERDKMKIAASIVAPQRNSHEQYRQEKSKPAPFACPRQAGKHRKECGTQPASYTLRGRPAMVYSPYSEWWQTHNARATRPEP
jgi:hypothetical protein